MKPNKIAATLAFIIGGMAVFAGGQVVLLGKVMDYYVIDWLPVYNLTLGLLTVFVTAALLWRDAAIAPKAALATLVSHSAVMLILQTAYRDVVAPDSIKAMTVRIAAWVIIMGIMVVYRRKNRSC
ncbi:MAG: hypothetical protein GXP40_10895 [Chloroflexi bacterium]|nr:hypothetical protein [Chloroflexota bacterium]